MKFKKLRKVYRIFFPKRFSSSEIFEHKLNQNKELTSYRKEERYYIVKLANTLNLNIRNENHSDYMVFEQVFNFRQYEIVLNLIKLNLNFNEEKIIIDAGANVAYTSIYFLNNLNNLFVYAVEPSHENASMCRENIALNNFESKINFYHRALSHKKGLKFQLDTKFRDSKDWAITTNQDIDGEIHGITLNEIISNNKLSHITLLKIDIEGAERFIFNVNNDFSFLSITKIIAIEIHDEFEIRDTIYKILKEYGYYLFETGELTVGINKNLWTI